jgi:hypothetical protein
MKTTGTIDVTVRVYLDMDLDEEDARDVVNDLEVSGYCVSHTETVSDNLKELFKQPS